MISHAPDPEIDIARSSKVKGAVPSEVDRQSLIPELHTDSSDCTACVLLLDYDGDLGISFVDDFLVDDVS